MTHLRAALTIAAFLSSVMLVACGGSSTEGRGRELRRQRRQVRCGRHAAEGFRRRWRAGPRARPWGPPAPRPSWTHIRPASRRRAMQRSRCATARASRAASSRVLAVRMRPAPPSAPATTPPASRRAAPRQRRVRPVWPACSPALSPVPYPCVTAGLEWWVRWLVRWVRWIVRWLRRLVRRARWLVRRARRLVGKRDLPGRRTRVLQWLGGRQPDRLHHRLSGHRGSGRDGLRRRAADIEEHGLPLAPGPGVDNIGGSAPSLVVETDVSLAPLTTLELGAAPGISCAPPTMRSWRRRGVGGSARAAPGGPRRWVDVVVADAGVEGLVLNIATRGVRFEEGGLVTAAAGEPWDELVAATVARGWAGLECLTGIPGRVGATPSRTWRLRTGGRRDHPAGPCARPTHRPAGDAFEPTAAPSATATACFAPPR